MLCAYFNFQQAMYSLITYHSFRVLCHFFFFFVIALSTWPLKMEISFMESTRWAFKSSVTPDMRDVCACVGLSECVRTAVLFLAGWGKSWLSDAWEKCSWQAEQWHSIVAHSFSPSPLKAMWTLTALREALEKEREKAVVSLLSL